jgi:hypothetical protein
VRDFSGRSILLLHRRGDRRSALVNLLHALGNTADGRDRSGRRFPNCGDLAGDGIGGFCGLHRERFHLGGDHGETLAGLTGARRLDRRIERKQIGMAGNITDQIDDVANPLRDLRQTGDLAVCALRFAHRDAYDLGRAHKSLVDLGDRLRHLLCRGRCHFDIRGCFVRRLRYALDALRCLAGRTQQGACHRPHLRSAVGGGFQKILSPLPERADCFFQHRAALFMLVR